eukprot:682802_1
MNHHKQYQSKVRFRTYVEPRLICMWIQYHFDNAIVNECNRNRLQRRKRNRLLSALYQKEAPKHDGPPRNPQPIWFMKHEAQNIPTRRGTIRSKQPRKGEQGPS